MAQNLRQLMVGVLDAGRPGAAGRTALGLVGAVFAAAVHAQALVDPTRPPAGWLARAAPAAERAASSVQTVKTSKTGPVALVDGQVVKIGDPLGEGRVIRITDSEVVLQRAGGATEVMKIHPRVEKHPAVHQPEASVGDVPAPLLRAGE